MTTAARASADVGLIGLALMGQNLALNIADHGYRVAVYNRTTAVMQKFVAGHADTPGGLVATAALPEFVGWRRRRRSTLGRSTSAPSPLSGAQESPRRGPGILALSADLIQAQRDSAPIHPSAWTGFRGDEPSAHRVSTFMKFVIPGRPTGTPAVITTVSPRCTRVDASAATRAPAISSSVVGRL
jgi:hypothetical protein